MLPFFNLLGSDVDFYTQQIAICEQCGLIVTQNPFSIEQLENRYKNFSKYEYDSDNYTLGLTEDYIKQCYHQKQFIDDNLENSSYESILEIGAASGFNLSIYKDKKRFGIEPSRINCKLAKQNYNIDMFNGMWTDYLYAHEDNYELYDLIFLSMVLEHIVNPYKFILECKNFCSKYMFIEIPTLDYKFLDEPYGMCAEEHVNIFTLHSLSYLMKQAGFSLINCEMNFGFNKYLPAAYPSLLTIWQKNDNAVIFKDIYDSSEKLDAYFKKSQLLLENIEMQIRNIPDNERLALWGIGHYVSMLMANTSLKNKNIIRVYDSDIKKKNMLFAGMDIIPFNINDAKINNVESILITTYTAQRAILKVLDEIKFYGKVYILHDNTETTLKI